MKTENRINYDKLMQELIAENRKEDGENKPSILLHSCCGPCSTAVIERLIEDFDITVFYFNPNIDDETEYGLRMENQIDFINRRYGEDGPVKFLEGRYCPEDFLEFAADYAEEPEGGARCLKCFEQRLEETLRVAERSGFDFFGTTLTVSPMKNSQVLNRLGLEIQEKGEVKYLVSDFKKRSGYQRSIQLSKEYGLYRQHFCGCSYSKRESEEIAARKAMEQK